MTSLLRKRDIFNEWKSLLKHLKFNPAHYCRDEAELMEQDSGCPHLNEEVELADLSLSEVSIVLTSNSHYLCFKGTECDYNRWETGNNLPKGLYGQSEDRISRVGTKRKYKSC